jgi:aryl sulfotransferase
VRYQSSDEDSARWNGFPFRDGDIVISTRSKSGTTWLQMICALLIFQSPDLPEPLAALSPWVDWLIMPREEMLARLQSQPHRRFVKTHTPLDGIPVDKRATYIVVARHPLDMAVSLIHQSDNIDRAKLRQLTGQPDPGPASTPVRRPVRDRLLRWIDDDDSPQKYMDGLRGVLWHLSGAWSRRHEANLVLVHFDDLAGDLEGEMRRLAARLDIEVPAERWPELVEAATFGQMKANAGRLAPDPRGIFRDRSAFFRRGISGGARELLTSEELAHYEARAASLAPPDLLAWLHRPSGGGPQ